MHIYTVPITDSPKPWMCAVAFHLISLSQTELLPFKYRELEAMLPYSTYSALIYLQNGSPELFKDSKKWVMWNQLFCLV